MTANVDLSIVSVKIQGMAKHMVAGVGSFYFGHGALLSYCEDVKTVEQLGVKDAKLDFTAGGSTFMRDFIQMNVRIGCGILVDQKLGLEGVLGGFCGAILARTLSYPVEAERLKARANGYESAAALDSSLVDVCKASINTNFNTQGLGLALAQSACIHVITRVLEPVLEEKLLSDEMYGSVLGTRIAQTAGLSIALFLTAPLDVMVKHKQQGSDKPLDTTVAKMFTTSSLWILPQATIAVLGTHLAMRAMRRVFQFDE